VAFAGTGDGGLCIQQFRFGGLAGRGILLAEALCSGELVQQSLRALRLLLRCATRGLHACEAGDGSVDFVQGLRLHGIHVGGGCCAMGFCLVDGAGIAIPRRQHQAQVEVELAHAVIEGIAGADADLRILQLDLLAQLELARGVGGQCAQEIGALQQRFLAPGRHIAVRQVQGFEPRIGPVQRPQPRCRNADGECSLIRSALHALGCCRQIGLGFDERRVRRAAFGGRRLARSDTPLDQVLPILSRCPAFLRQRLLLAREQQRANTSLRIAAQAPRRLAEIQQGTAYAGIGDPLLHRTPAPAVQRQIDDQAPQPIGAAAVVMDVPIEAQGQRGRTTRLRRGDGGNGLVQRGARFREARTARQEHAGECRLRPRRWRGQAAGKQSLAADGIVHGSGFQRSAACRQIDRPRRVRRATGSQQHQQPSQAHGLHGPLRNPWTPECAAPEPCKPWHEAYELVIRRRVTRR